MNNRAENEEREERPVYEAPAIIDHGSLAALTLATAGNFTDGAGIGGGGS